MIGRNLLSSETILFSVITVVACGILLRYLLRTNEKDNRDVKKSESEWFSNIRRKLNIESSDQHIVTEKQSKDASSHYTISYASNNKSTVHSPKISPESIQMSTIPISKKPPSDTIALQAQEENKLSRNSFLESEEQKQQEKPSDSRLHLQEEALIENTENENRNESIPLESNIFASVKECNYEENISKYDSKQVENVTKLSEKPIMIHITAENEWEEVEVKKSPLEDTEIIKQKTTASVSRSTSQSE